MKPGLAALRSKRANDRLIVIAEETLSIQSQMLSRPQDFSTALRPFPWIVGRPRHSTHRRMKDHCRNALWAVGREEDAHRPAFGVPKESCNNCVHDSPHIIHSLLKRWHRAHTVGAASPPPVEENEAADRRQAFQKPYYPRVLVAEG